MEDESKDNQAAMAELLENNSNLIDGLYELMERLNIGNPRLLKKERKVFTTFFSLVIDQLSLTTKYAESLNRLREAHKINDQSAERLIAVHEERIKLDLMMLKALRDLLENDRVEDALDMLNKTLRRLDRKDT